MQTLYVELCIHAYIASTAAEPQASILTTINRRIDLKSQRERERRKVQKEIGWGCRKWGLNTRLNVIEMKFSLHVISDSDFIALNIQTLRHTLCSHREGERERDPLKNVMKYTLCVNWTSAHRSYNFTAWLVTTPNGLIFRFIKIYPMNKHFNDNKKNVHFFLALDRFTTFSLFSITFHLIFRSKHFKKKKEEHNRPNEMIKLHHKGIHVSEWGEYNSHFEMIILAH